jgi:hypothetical protein
MSNLKNPTNKPLALDALDMFDGEHQSERLHDAFMQLAEGLDRTAVFSAATALLIHVSDRFLTREGKDLLMSVLDERIQIGGVQ